MILTPLEDSTLPAELHQSGPVQELLEATRRLLWRALWVFIAGILFQTLTVLALYRFTESASPTVGAIVVVIGLSAFYLTWFLFYRAVSVIRQKAVLAGLVLMARSRERPITLDETDFIRLIAGQEVSRDGVAVILADIGADRMLQIAADFHTNFQWSLQVLAPKESCPNEEKP